jgi:hypothetical protein
MTEFKSFIFEKLPAKNQSLIWWIIGGLLVLGGITVVLDLATFWSSMLFIMLPALLYYYVRFSDIKFGEKEDLNGFFTDELTINVDGVKIGESSFPTDKIKSLLIRYDNIYGTKTYSAYSGTSTRNGETNVLTIVQTDNKVIKYNFKLASIGHAKQLIEVTELLKEKVIIKNDWKINYNA